MIEGRKILTPEQLDKLDQIPLYWPGFMDRWIMDGGIISKSGGHGM
jgi:hypothetical protein